MQPSPLDRGASIQQLLNLERYKLAELLRQQAVERTLSNGHPESLDPDVRTCREMIRIWTDRLQQIVSSQRAA